MNAPGTIAAFFDLDGTMLPAPSLEWRFASNVDQAGLFNLPGWIAHAAKNILRDPPGTICRNKSYLAGLPETLAADWARSLGREHFSPAISSPEFDARDGLPFFPAALSRLAWHAERQHSIFFISGTLAPLAKLVAQDLSRRLTSSFSTGANAREPKLFEVCATELEIRDGRWTGQLAGPHVTGEAKAACVRMIAARDGIALGESYAYGDSFADILMLESAGHCAAVNPSLLLAYHAHKRGWEILRWTNRTDQTSTSHAKIAITKGAQ